MIGASGFKFFILILFLALASIGYCQEEDLSEREKYLRQFAKDPDAVKSDKDLPPPTQPDDGKDTEGKWPGVGTVQVRTIPTGTSRPTASGQIEEADEAEIADLEERRERLESLTKELGQQGSGPEGGSLDAEKLKQLQGLQGQLQGNPLAILMGKGPDGAAGTMPKMKFSEMAKQIVSGMGHLTEADIILMIHGRFQKGFMADLVRRPKVAAFLARCLKDPEILPSLAGISENRKMLAVYGSFILVSFFFGYLLKRFMNRHEADGPLTGIKRFMFRTLIMTSIRLGAFFWLFQKEFKPLWKLVGNNFF